MKMKRWMSVLLCTVLITAAVPSFSLSAAAASEEGDRTASDISDLKEMLESEDSLIDRITGKHDEEEEDSEQSLTIVSSTTTEDADDLSLKSGDKLPLFVLVSGGESPYTYSWLIRRGEDDSWHEIGTDAAVSYTIGSADNGAEIQCIVKDAKGEEIRIESIVLTVSDVYVFPFRDVSKSDWYYPWVKEAHQMGLISGLTTDEFGPEDSMTYAQAIALAARMNELYDTGSVTLVNGIDKWYSTYVDYCISKGIISQRYESVINRTIDRKTYVMIFSKALPSEAFDEKNVIPDNSIPDVKKGAVLFYDSIYTFYRAGILNGSDDAGTFCPDSDIRRCEVAAILVRMMDPAVRVSAPVSLAGSQS